MDPASGADEVPTGTTDDEPGPVPGSLGPHPERHPDDLPPPPPERRRMPAGILWAVALGLLVLTIAMWVALSSETSTPSADVVRLSDPDATVAGAGLGGIDKTGQPASGTSFTTFDGGTTSVAALAGTPAVVNFWSSTCPPCITEMPALERVHQQLGGEVAFIGLAVTDPESQARALATKTGVSYPLGFDPTGQIIGEFGGTVLPTTIFVDASGTIVDSFTGELDEAQLLERIHTNFGVAPTAGS